MNISKTTPLLFFSLLFLPLLLQTPAAAAAGDSDPQLYHICSTGGGATPSKLLQTVAYKAPPTGFATASRDSSYALALCRGDVSPVDCNTCLSGAAVSLADICPNSRAGVVWYDFCLLKYSDSDFFGRVDGANKFSLHNVMNVSSHAPLFTKKVRELLTGLVKEAAGDRGGLYAVAKEDLGEFTTLYGLVQCTRDLTAEDCRRCLDEAVSELGSCCDGKQGGRVVGGSCNFRYEIYAFFNSN